MQDNVNRVLEVEGVRGVLQKMESDGPGSITLHILALFPSFSGVGGSTGNVSNRAPRSQSLL